MSEPTSALAAYRERLEVAKIATPLWVYLYIYEKANHACYTPHMQGAKMLATFLSPIEAPVFPDTCKVPIMLGNYETQELEKILGIKEETIILSTINEVIPRLEL